MTFSPNYNIVQTEGGSMRDMNKTAAQSDIVVFWEDEHPCVSAE